MYEKKPWLRFYGATPATIDYPRTTLYGALHAQGHEHETEAEATRIRGAGEAEAARSYAVFEKNPELQTFLLKLQALENTLNQLRSNGQLLALYRERGLTLVAP
mgnify:CR=1 FL=1